MSSEKFTIPKHMKSKMHRLAKLSQKVSELDNEISEYFISLGFDEESLRCGSGNSLEELIYGNDVTDEFCAYIENTMKKDL